MDIVHGHSPIRRTSYRRRLRPQVVLVRPRIEQQAIQSPSVSHPIPSLFHFPANLSLSNSRRYHTRAIRSLCFHPTYPLFASSSDDGTVQVFHARVYSDMMTDPLIVPLKILRGHEVKNGIGVLQIRWCPGQPWLVSTAADGSVGVWCA